MESLLDVDPNVLTAITANLHNAMRSIGSVSLYVACWFVDTAIVGEKHLFRIIMRIEMHQ